MKKYTLFLGATLLAVSVLAACSGTKSGTTIADTGTRQECHAAGLDYPCKLPEKTCTGYDCE